jgi:succinoglycan biosynthesis transport protein ExoP
LRKHVTDAYLGQLAIVPADTSRVIYVRITSPDASLAATLANTAAQIYIDDQVAGKTVQTELANVWLQDRAVELKHQVESAAQAVEAHRRKAGLIDLAGSSLLAQQLGDLNGRLIVVHAELAESEARYAQVEKLIASSDGVGSAAAVLNSPLIQKLREQEAQVVRKISELETQLRESHPDMILARNELDDLVVKIETEVQKIIVNLGSELEIVRVREDNLTREIAKLQAKLDSQAGAEIKLVALETELEANGKLYDTILERLKETDVQDASTVRADARIISYATVPGAASFPRKRLIVGSAFVASTVLGVLLVLLLEQLDSGFRAREQIENATGVSVLGMIPRLRSGWFSTAQPHEDILDRPNTVLAEAFRSLRTALLLSNVDRPPRTVLVTSSVPGEGKSTTALALARTAAKHSQKCLIIDADLRHPSLHRAFGVGNDIGLIDYLSRGMALEDIVQIDFKSGAHYILAGQSAPHSTDLLGSEMMRAMLAALREVYDLVVVDTPPVLALSDTLVLLRSVDKTIFLVQWEKTWRETALAGLRQVLDAGADLAGSVLSQVDLKRQAQYHYGSSYYTYYNSAYQKYYNRG